MEENKQEPFADEHSDRTPAGPDEINVEKSCNGPVETDTPPLVDVDISVTTAESAIGTPLQEAIVSVAGGIVIKKTYLAIALVMIAVLTVGSLFLGMWIHKQQTLRQDGIDPSAKDYQGAFINAGNADGNAITVPGYSDVFFSANTQKVQIVLLNPDQNPCYFRFSLILPRTDETLYRSGLIPPGMAVTEIELSRPLEAGVYDLCIRIDAYALADRTAMNGAEIETKLIVSN